MTVEPDGNRCVNMVGVRWSGWKCNGAGWTETACIQSQCLSTALQLDYDKIGLRDKGSIYWNCFCVNAFFFFLHSGSFFSGYYSSRNGVPQYSVSVYLFVAHCFISL